MTTPPARPYDAAQATSTASGNGDPSEMTAARRDIAVLWLPHGAPVVIAAFSDRGSTDASSDDGMIAQATTGLHPEDTGRSPGPGH